MCAGQVLDLMSETHKASHEELVEIKSAKRGAYPTSASLMGCLPPTQTTRKSEAAGFIPTVGSAFQMVDDVLGSQPQPRRNSASHRQRRSKTTKTTFVTPFGVGKDHTGICKGIDRKAKNSLDVFGENADTLKKSRRRFALP